MAKKNTTKTDSTTILQPVSNVVDLPANLIDADYDWNARSVLDFKGLAESIKREGQQSPVIVRKEPSGRYDLLVGFRRFAAMTFPEKEGGLGLPTIRATIVERDPKKDDEQIELDDLMTNLVENVARDDLSPYDLCMRVYSIHDEHELSPGKIAARCGKSESYIDNLIRIAKNVHPTILKRWKEETGPTPPPTKVLNVNNLAKIAKNGVTHDEQLKAYGEWMGTTPADREKGNGAGNGAGNDGPKHVSKSEVEKALVVVGMVEKDGEFEDESFLKGVRAALRFVKGEIKSIPGVYSPQAKVSRADKESASK